MYCIGIGLGVEEPFIQFELGMFGGTTQDWVVPLPSKQNPWNGNFVDRKRLVVRILTSNK
jgi:hypothetical protein